MFGTLVSDIQTGLSVSNDNATITGTLKYLSTGAIADYWGAGNFMALKFTLPTGTTSCKVGMNPSQGSGLVELVGDPDLNGVFKVTNKNTQKFKVVTRIGSAMAVKEYDLSGLTCNQS